MLGKEGGKRPGSKGMPVAEPAAQEVWLAGLGWGIKHRKKRGVLMVEKNQPE